MYGLLMELLKSLSSNNLSKQLILKSLAETQGFFFVKKATKLKRLVLGFDMHFQFHKDSIIRFSVNDHWNVIVFVWVKGLVREPSMRSQE